MHLKERKQGYMGGFRGRKWYNCIIISNTKINKRRNSEKFYEFLKMYKYHGQIDFLLEMKYLSISNIINQCN